MLISPIYTSYSSAVRKIMVDCTSKISVRGDDVDYSYITTYKFGSYKDQPSNFKLIEIVGGYLLLTLSSECRDQTTKSLYSPLQTRPVCIGLTETLLGFVEFPLGSVEFLLYPLLFFLQGGDLNDEHNVSNVFFLK